MRRPQLLAGICLAPFLWSSAAFAQWTLEPASSSLSFTSVKNDTIAEHHSAKQFTASVSDAGALTGSVDLTQLDTNIEVRDERLRTMLFETEQFSEATITGNIDPALLEAETGSVTTIETTLNLTLHGTTQSLPAKLSVARLNESQLLVSTLTPIMVNAADFALAEGVEKLREVAGLSSIAVSVPVTGMWLFKKD